MPFIRGPLDPQKLFAPAEAFVVSSLAIVPLEQDLVLATFVPSVATPRLMTPSNAVLTLTEFAPSVKTPRLVTPASQTLTLSTFAPAVSTPRLIAPASQVLTLSTFAPTWSGVSGSVSVAPGSRPLTFTTYPPEVQGDFHARQTGHAPSDRARVVSDNWRYLQGMSLHQNRLRENRTAIIALFQSGAITEEEFALLLAAA